MRCNAHAPVSEIFCVLCLCIYFALYTDGRLIISFLFLNAQEAHHIYDVNADFH